MFVPLNPYHLPNLYAFYPTSISTLKPLLTASALCLSPTQVLACSNAQRGRQGCKSARAEMRCAAHKSGAAMRLMPCTMKDCACSNAERSTPRAKRTLRALMKVQRPLRSPEAIARGVALALLNKRRCSVLMFDERPALRFKARAACTCASWGMSPRMGCNARQLMQVRVAQQCARGPLSLQQCGAL